MPRSEDPPSGGTDGSVRTTTLVPMNTTTIPRRTTGAAAIASAVLLIQSLVWLLLPDLNPYIDPHLAELRAVLPLSAHSWMLAVLGLVGTIGAGIAALRPENTAAARVVGILAPIVTLGLFAATAGMSGLSFAGYLVAMALPLVAIATGIVAAVRAPRARLPLALAVIIAVVVVVVFRDLIASVFVNNITAFGLKAWTMWALTLTLTTIAGWLVLTLRTVRSARWAAVVTAWLVRHRRPITVLAAIGPLPYALLRLTWLTPWPLGMPDNAGAPITAWGFMLSLGAWMGVVLTLGLILPWGERLPAWMPRVGGRPVPPAAAVVPGSIVAGLLCLAAIPWTIGFAQNPAGGFALYFFVLPIGYWGVMLALAVWAYAGHRAGTGTVPHPDGPVGPGAASPAATTADTMVR